MSEVKVLNKKEFMQQYILGRANAKPEGLNVNLIARNAEEVFSLVEAACATGSINNINKQ